MPQAYHSSFNESSFKTCCSCALLPLFAKNSKGPAPRPGACVEPSPWAEGGTPLVSLESVVSFSSSFSLNLPRLCRPRLREGCD